MIPPHRGRARLILALLFVFTAISFADKVVLGLAAQPIMAELGLSATQFGSIASSFYLLFIVSAVAVGFVGNRVSPRWLLIVLAVVWALAQLPILFTAAGIATLVATRILLGAGEGPVPVLTNHTAFSWFPLKERTIAAAVITTGAAAGVLVGAPVLQWFITQFGWRSAFGFLGAIGLVWAVAWFMVGGRGPHDADGEDTSASAAMPATDSPPRQPYRKLLLSPTLLGAILGSFAVYWVLAFSVVFAPLYLRQAGYAPTTISYLVGLPSLLSIVVVLSGGTISKRLLKRGVSRRWAQGAVGGGAAVVGGLALLALSQVSGGITLVVLLTVGFAAGTVLVPLSSTAVADFVPVTQRSAVLGVWYAVTSVSSIASPYVTGLLVDSSPSAGYQNALLLAGGLLVVGGVAAVTLMSADRDRSRLAARSAGSRKEPTPAVGA